jgi:hypothetical protein
VLEGEGVLLWFALSVYSSCIGIHRYVCIEFILYFLSGHIAYCLSVLMATVKSPVLSGVIYIHNAHNKSTICKNWLGVLMIF